MLVDLRKSFLDQIKLMGLIDLTLILILASNSKGQSWNIDVSRHINATLGSNVTIPCTFTVPLIYNTTSVQVYWRKREGNNFDSLKNDKNPYVFHPNNALVLEEYRGKTKLIGNENKGNCSLKIFDIRNNEPNIYVRVVAKGEKFSFYADSVSISVSGLAVSPIIPDPNMIQPIPTFQTTTIFSTVGTTQEPPPQWPVAIFVSVGAILIVIVVVGIVFGIKHKRSKSFTRKDSGYYANFSRANQLKREASCKKQEHKEPSELKDIDEPVYINIEAPPDQMDQSPEHTDNIYGNVDYSK